jgi:hypothetical protein
LTMRALFLFGAFLVQHVHCVEFVIPFDIYRKYTCNTICDS